MSQRVAVISANLLQRIGMVELMERYFAHVDVDSLDGIPVVWGAQYDFYFVDISIYATKTEYFLPRRGECILLCERPPCSDSVRTLDLSISLESMIETLTTILAQDDTAAAASDDDRASNPCGDEISAREIQVLQLVVSGDINKEIAQKLNISLNTVLTHRKNITSKLGIKTVSGLTLYALMHGYISPDSITP